MSEKAPGAISTIPLRAQLNGLSTRLMIGGDREGFVELLKLIAEAAGEEGFAETAQLAASLSESLQGAASKDPPLIENTLRKGLSLLQEALDSENAELGASKKDLQGNAAPVNPLAQDPELVGDFVMESREHLAAIEGQMLALEQNPSDTEVIHAVFRAFHTIKGLAGFLDFGTIQKVAHEVETLLDLARNRKGNVTPGMVDVVLESADYLKQSIEAVESALSGKPAKTLGEPIGLLHRIQRAYSTDGVPSPEQASSCVPATAAAETSRAGPKAADKFSVRVETDKLDYLMDMVGEMVIAQSLIRNNPALTSLQNPRLSADLLQLARITADVQRTAMAMRMIPMGQLFQRTARMVRDLSRKTGKAVELEMSGEDTEVDKSIAEQLSDPLLHMVRNSLDHGVEAPAERKAAGKSETAHISLTAFHRAGQIVVEIADDGRGLDEAKILKKAQQQGLVRESAQLSENEIFHLIFEPGFSTADKVSDISGRGVGMDVVRRNIQKLQGRIDIHSVAGKGARFILSLPLTLAIIEGLVVDVGGRRYIVPIFDVREMIRPSTEMISSVQGRDEMALIRGRLLPVVRLSRRFGLKARSEEICDGLLVVVESDGKQFCLLVDHLVGKQEVVIKSLGETLKNINGIGGCAILGDGRIGLILDMHGLFRGHRK